jgi:hypothetical protein
MQAMTDIPTSTGEQPEYLSFLLRLWRMSGAEGAQHDAEAIVWRASLQDTLTNERVSFTRMEDLVAYLRRRMGVVSDAE